VLTFGFPRASKGTGLEISSLLPAPNSIDRSLNCQLQSESLALLALPTDTLRYSCGQQSQSLSLELLNRVRRETRKRQGRERVARTLGSPQFTRTHPRDIYDHSTRPHRPSRESSVATSSNRQLAMSNSCQAANCNRLVQAAIPFVRTTRLSQNTQPTHIGDFNVKKFCSKGCAEKGISPVTCKQTGCKRLISDTLPHATNLYFNTREYCSRECYWAIEDDADVGHDGDGTKSTNTLVTCDVCAIEKPPVEDDANVSHRVDDTIWTNPLSTCDVCATETPAIDYVKVNGYTDSIPLIPEEHVSHLVPALNLSRTEALVCIECIRSYVLIQFRNHGSGNITCVHPHHPGENVHLINEQWQSYAYGFLPKKLHGEYAHRTFEEWWARADKWECPAGCTTIGVTLESNPTPGYPNVECPECQGRFCGRCRVKWYDGQTCSQYIAEHPQTLPEEEIALLTEMAAMGARRCPKCHYVGIKEEGCAHMFCEQCYHHYDWRQAEKVQAP
jgi:hypothetical protein